MTIGELIEKSIIETYNRHGMQHIYTAIMEYISKQDPQYISNKENRTNLINYCTSKKMLEVIIRKYITAINLEKEKNNEIRPLRHAVKSTYNSYLQQNPSQEYATKFTMDTIIEYIYNGENNFTEGQLAKYMVDKHCNRADALSEIVSKVIAKVIEEHNKSLQQRNDGDER